MALSDHEQRELQRLLAKASGKEMVQVSAGTMSDGSKRRSQGVTQQDSEENEEFELIAGSADDLAVLKGMYADQDTRVPLPEDCKTAEQWGTTKLLMEKYKKDEMCYESLILKAINGDQDAGRYCLFIMRKYGDSKAKTQAPDFARFLKRIKYDERKVETTGFVRTFVR